MTRTAASAANGNQSSAPGTVTAAAADTLGINAFGTDALC